MKIVTVGTPTKMTSSGAKSESKIVPKKYKTLYLSPPPAYIRKVANKKATS